MAGFVSFVSSGPGDPELLTLKAIDRLERADAVLFDDLSSGPILSYAKAGADLIGVGKRADRASPKQHAVTRLLLCLLYTSPSPRDATLSRMPSSA